MVLCTSILLEMSLVVFSPLMCSMGRLQDFKMFITVLKTSFVCRVKLTDRNPENEEDVLEF